MTRKEIVVFGASGHGKVVGDAARSMNFELRAFVDDSPGKTATTLWNLPVLSFEKFLERRREWSGIQVALGVGSNAVRQGIHARLLAADIPVATIIHTATVISSSASVGDGTVLMAGAVVNSDVLISAGCIINTGAVVEHDCVLGAYVHISPNAAIGGNVHIGDRTHLSIGALVIPGTRVGSDVVVGAGAVVIRDIPDGSTVVGVPARPITRKA